VTGTFTFTVASTFRVIVIFTFTFVCFLCLREDNLEGYLGGYLGGYLMERPNYSSNATMPLPMTPPLASCSLYAIRFAQLPDAAP
jgi:hypothetical protein